MGSQVAHQTEQNEGTIITIGSSSDEEEKDSLGSSRSDGELNISYERPIFDTDVSESTTSGEIISDQEEVQLNFGLCESDGISIASEKNRSLSDLSEHNQKTSISSLVGDIDNGHHKDPKLFDSFSSDSQSDDVEQTELDKTKIEHSKELRKSEGLFHGYILSSEITDENSDEKMAIESCNIPLAEQESIVHDRDREPHIFEENEFDNTVEVSTTGDNRSEKEEGKSRQSIDFLHGLVIEAEVAKIEKVYENDLGEMRKAESELVQPISTETDEINQVAQLDSNLSDVSEIMPELVYVPLVHDSIKDTELAEISNNENTLETTNQLLLKQDTSNSSYKSTVSPILDKKSKTSVTKGIQLQQKSESNVKEETNQTKIGKWL